MSSGGRRGCTQRGGIGRNARCGGESWHRGGAPWRRLSIPLSGAAATVKKGLSWTRGRAAAEAPLAESSGKLMRAWERERSDLGRSLCARRTPHAPNKCAGLALTHRIGASVVGGLWIHADQGGRTNARSRDAATVQGVVVVIPWFEARLAAHSDCADEQHEGCQGTPRARHVVTCPDASDATAPRKCGLRAFERVSPLCEKKRRTPDGHYPLSRYPNPVIPAVPRASKSSGRQSVISRSLPALSADGVGDHSAQ